MDAANPALSARLEVQKLHELPPLPLVVDRFLAAIQNPHTELGEFASLIEQDPALLARIIGVANSAYFATPHPVTRAEEAILRVLGYETTKGLVLSIILSGPFDPRRCPTFNVERFWLESIFTATLAQSLAPLATCDTPLLGGEAYLAGLLHKIGLLALVHIYPEQMTGVIGRLGQHADLSARVAEERRVLQVDHCEVGGWIARKWHLPLLVVDTMEHYLDGQYHGGNWPLVRLVHFSARWAAAAMLDEVDEAYPSLSELSELRIDMAKAGNRLGKVALRLDELRELARLFSA